jgi:hypothetical protein
MGVGGRAQVGGEAAAMIVMGANDLAHCLSGWHVRERDERNGVCYRWTGAEAQFRIGAGPGSRALRLMVSGPSALTGRPVPLSLYAAGHRVAHLPAAASADAWTIVDLPLAEAASPGPIFMLRVEVLAGDESPAQRGTAQVFVPDLYLRNGDFRELGIMVASIRVV